MNILICVVKLCPFYLQVPDEIPHCTSHTCRNCEVVAKTCKDKESGAKVPKAKQHVNLDDIWIYLDLLPKKQLFFHRKHDHVRMPKDCNGHTYPVILSRSSHHSAKDLTWRLCAEPSHPWPNAKMKQLGTPPWIAMAFRRPERVRSAPRKCVADRSDR